MVIFKSILVIVIFEAILAVQSVVNPRYGLSATVSLNDTGALQPGQSVRPGQLVQVRRNKAAL